MSDNAELIERFYTAFQSGDGSTMASLYHPDASFSDPVFTALHGSDIGDMWQMLCERGKDLEVDFHSVEANGDHGRAHWDATYTFSATGRRVHNSIDAEFTFRDGRIASHRDRFDLYRWCRQALGLKGTLIGWLPPVQQAIRKQAAASLSAWQRR